MIGKDFFTLIEISEICSIDTDFIKELVRFGIIEVHKRGNSECVGQDTIDVLKMARRLYFDLGVNKEGIDIILSMRRQILDLQDKVIELKGKVNYLTHEQTYRNLEIIMNRGLLFDL
jgi:hypothetical protein